RTSRPITPVWLDRLAFRTDVRPVAGSTPCQSEACLAQSLSELCLGRFSTALCDARPPMRAGTDSGRSAIHQVEGLSNFHMQNPVVKLSCIPFAEALNPDHRARLTLDNPAHRLKQRLIGEREA